MWLTHELAALQQHIGLALLHPISDLLLRSPFADDGLIGWVEIPLVLAAVVVTLSTARRWEPRLHPLALWVVDLLEGVLALVALVAVLGLAAVACSLASSTSAPWAASASPIAPTSFR